MSDIAIFLASCFGYALRGWLGKVLLTLFWKVLKILFRLSEDEILVYMKSRETKLAKRLNK